MKSSVENIDKIKDILYNDCFSKETLKDPYIEGLIAKLKQDLPHLEIVDKIDGLSTTIQRAFLNKLIGSFNNINYMEIGLYHGATLASAIINNHNNLNKIVGNDKWEWGDANYEHFKSNVNGTLLKHYGQHHDFISAGLHKTENAFGEGYCLGETEIFTLDKKMVGPIKNFDITIVKGDTWKHVDTILSQWGEDKVDIYFYDGCHEFQSQVDAILHFEPCFAEEFILLVDDFKDEETRLGTFHGLKKIGYDVLFSEETVGWGPAPSSYDGWGGGWLIAYLMKR